MKKIFLFIFLLTILTLSSCKNSNIIDKKNNESDNEIVNTDKKDNNQNLSNDSTNNTTDNSSSNNNSGENNSSGSQSENSSNNKHDTENTYHNSEQGQGQESSNNTGQQGSTNDDGNTSVDHEEGETKPLPNDNDNQNGSQNHGNNDDSNHNGNSNSNINGQNSNDTQDNTNGASNQDGNISDQNNQGNTNNQENQENETNSNQKQDINKKTIDENKQSENDNVFEKLNETKIEFKNITEASLYHLNSNNYTKVLSITDFDSDINNYKIKIFVKDLGKNVWLDVVRIEENNDTYKFFGSFNNSNDFINILYDGTIKNTFDLYIKKVIKKVNHYYSFKELINAIKQNPSNDFIISNDLTASEVLLNNNDYSYLDNIVFSGKLLSEKGNNFSIYDLKKPLFNEINNALISNIDFYNVNVTSTAIAVGSIVNISNNSNIENVNVYGSVNGDKVAGGIAGKLDLESVILNSSFNGSVFGLNVAGGIAAVVTRQSAIKNSIVNITISSASDIGDKLGGVVGELGSGSSILDVLVKGNITNLGNKKAYAGAAIGGIFSVSNLESPDKGVINNLYINTNIVNAKQAIGNIEFVQSYEKVLQNIYITTDLLTTNHTSYTKIDENTFKEKEKLFNKNNSSTNLDYIKKLNFSYLNGYNHSYEKAYYNISKLIPFYDRYTIIKLANTLDTNTNLYNKTIKIIQFYNNLDLVKNLYKEKNNINKLVIYYTDNTKEEFELTNPNEFNNTKIIDYNFNLNNKIYKVHLNKLYINKKDFYYELINDIKNTQFNHTLFNTVGINEYEKDVEIKKLFIDYYFNDIKNNIETVLDGVIDNSDIFNNDSNNFKLYYKNLLNSNKNQILVGLNYLYSWYTISNYREKLLYNLDFYGTTSDSLNLILELGNIQVKQLKGYKSDLVYTQFFSKYLKPATVIDFILYNYDIDKKQNQDIDTYIKSITKTYLVKTESLSNPELNLTILDRFKEPEHSYKLLPLLSVKEENEVYFILTTNSNISGIFEAYTDYIPKTAANYKQKIEDIKSKIDKQAVNIQRFYDTYYRILNERSKNKLSKTIIDVFDTLSRGPASSYSWTKEYDSYDGKALKGYKFYVGPIGSYHYFWNSNAFVPFGTIHKIYFVHSKVLENSGLSVLSHEHTHTFDDLIILDGYGKRAGHGAESFAFGFFQAPDFGAQEHFAFNFIMDYDKNYSHHNTSPERFQNIDDLNTYYKNLFDLIYVLDLAEADAIIHNKNLRTNQYDYIKPYTDPNKAIPTNNDVIDSLQNYQAYRQHNNLSFINSIDDLVDHNIVGKIISEVKGSTYNTVGIGADDYVSIDMFSPMFGILENTQGISGDITFRRTSFELLAEKGFYEGLIPYASSKYIYDKNNYENVVRGSDTHILKMIFGNKYNSFKDFKKDMYRKRKEKLHLLKPFEFTDFGSNSRTIRINNYEELKQLFIKNYNKNSGRKSKINQLRNNIHYAILKLTEEFKTSIFNQN